MQSILNMGDPKIEPQLVNGFHGVEAGAWRWTAKQFTVACGRRSAPARRARSSP